MSKIVERMFEIIRMLEEELSSKAKVDRCYNPEFYLESLTSNESPFVLVCYKGSLYRNSKLYPCNSTFEIYFADLKSKADELLDLMQNVYNFFNNNVVKSTDENGKVIAGQKLIYQDQNFYAENNEYVIYMQRYNLLIT